MADEAEQFQTRANQFGNVSERLTATHDALRRFTEAGVEVAFVPAMQRGYAAKAQDTARSDQGRSGRAATIRRSTSSMRSSIGLQRDQQRRRHAR